MAITIHPHQFSMISIMISISINHINQGDSYTVPSGIHVNKMDQNGKIQHARVFNG
jgi:hypothetical protein